MQKADVLDCLYVIKPDMLLSVNCSGGWPVNKGINDDATFQFLPYIMRYKSLTIYDHGEYAIQVVCWDVTSL